MSREDQAIQARRGATAGPKARGIALFRSSDPSCAYFGEVRARVRARHGLLLLALEQPTAKFPKRRDTASLARLPADARWEPAIRRTLQRAPVRYLARDELQIQWLLPYGAKSLAGGPLIFRVAQ